MWGLPAVEAVMLLAKSAKEGCAPKGLAEHCGEVMDAFEALFGKRGAPTRLGKEWLRFFKLGEEDFEGFFANGLASCGLHDIGKANDGFQRAVTKKGEQLLRHEHLSGMILALPEVQAWLDSNSQLDSDIVLSAVIGHHLKASQKDEPYYGSFAQPVSVMGRTLILYVDNLEFRECFDAVAKRLGMAPCTAIVPRIWSLTSVGDQPIENARGIVETRFDPRKTQELKNSSRRHQLLMAVKAAVIAADAAGSGLVREDIALRQWLHDAFKDALTAEEIDCHIIKKRIRAIETRTDNPFNFHDFQEHAARLGNRALLLASCGTGKTLAAWRWIEARLRERPQGRVLFLYPTRATATEGFRDYVSHAPETDAALLSGTARYELRDMFGNPDDERHGRNYLTEERLYALGFWQKRVFSATVDQFFGFLQQGYGGICLLPVLADSVVVIDEIHSFDTGMFSALLKFLDRFDAPVLCMTASLPARRREALQALGLEVFPDEKQQFVDLERRARLPRYRIKKIKGMGVAEEIARKAVAEDRRVLWVVNTVDRCQALASRMTDLQPLCYHSRFTLEHRKARHTEVVNAFQDSSRRGMLAITTQVCEMSLDLDAQVLISELAPIPALIQRMGRCNRHSQQRGEPLGEVNVYDPESNLPYPQEEMTLGRELIGKLTGKRTSQADLEGLLEEFTSAQEAEGERLIAFVADGFWSRGGAEELRENEDFTVPAVLDSDVEDYLATRRKDEPGDGFVVPVPRRFVQRRDSRLPGFLYVAPSSHYVAELGFLKEAPKRERAVVL
ncbi:MAG: CRISPR-associated helicase Cas3' [Gammaproteobacteria bacterium]|nr:MAG: CRISPR-associated helicase Cas3' [Gammaproteobacteria bacterium]